MKQSPGAGLPDYGMKIMPTIVTWNMQGASWATEMKWRMGVANMLSNGADVVCLQECGAIPRSATFHWQDAQAPELSLHTWGTSRRPIYILFYLADLSGNRVNLAIASHHVLWPGNVRPVLFPAGLPARRPAIGVTIGNETFYCVHAISPNGPDASRLLSAIRLDVLGTDKFVGGDFNREPPVLSMGGMQVCLPDQPTYPTSFARRRYDYLYTDLVLPVSPVGQVLNLLASDHYPVAYQI
jgi:cytolethal distending toxin subunit B